MKHCLDTEHCESTLTYFCIYATLFPEDRDMAAGRARLTIDIEPGVHAQLKVVVAMKGTSMRDYCIKAIRRQLSEEPSEYLTAEADPVLAELWDNDDDADYDNL